MTATRDVPLLRLLWLQKEEKYLGEHTSSIPMTDFSELVWSKATHLLQQACLQPTGLHPTAEVTPHPLCPAGIVTLLNTAQSYCEQLR